MPHGETHPACSVMSGTAHTSGVPTCTGPHARFLKLAAHIKLTTTVDSGLRETVSYRNMPAIFQTRFGIETVPARKKGPQKRPLRPTETRPLHNRLHDRLHNRLLVPITHSSRPARSAMPRATEMVLVRVTVPLAFETARPPGGPSLRLRSSCTSAPSQYIERGDALNPERTKRSKAA